jgi:hypothetical protein
LALRGIDILELSTGYRPRIAYSNAHAPYLRVIDRESKQSRGKERENTEKIPPSQHLVLRAEWGDVCRKKERKFERV